MAVAWVLEEKYDGVVFELLYICYTYSDIEVSLCLKALVTHLAIGHVAHASVILV